MYPRKLNTSFVALLALSTSTVGLAVACGDSGTNPDTNEDGGGASVDSGSGGNGDGGGSKLDAGSDASTLAFTVGGTVEGLAGDGLVLQVSSGGQTITLPKPAAAGDAGPGSIAFTFPNKVPQGTAYAVTVKTQPTNATQTCSVMNGTGTIGNANVANVKVVCATNAYTIKGTITGLAAGATVTLKNNGGDPIDLTTASAGFPAFTFTTKVASGAAYDVKVTSQPTTPHQVCTVTKGAGPVTNADITDVAVDCKNAYTVGGTVTGLGSKTLVLQNNAGDDLTLTEATAGFPAFTFGARVATGAPYAVTVKTQPANRNCVVTNGASNMGASDVTNVQVSCTCLTNKVLLLGCGNGETDLFETALTSNGFAVTKVATATTYANNPAANTFNSVLVLVGDEWGTNMDAAGQSGIVAANAAGTGVVFTSWGTYKVGAGQWTTLAPLLLRAAAGNQTVGVASATSTVVAGMEAHPLWKGMPASFTYASTGYDNTPAKGGVLTIATGTGAIYARDAANGAGRAVEEPWAVGWAGTSVATNADAMRSYMNSVRWTSTCE